MLSQDDVIYQIVTDRFSDGDRSNDADVDTSDPQKRHGGDLLGIVRRMPYLKELGVTALWISPVYPNPVAGYHGYHPLDFESVDPHLCSESLGAKGSRETICKFVQIAHENGFKVILDVIVSHTAIANPWLKERPDWFDAQGSSLPEKWWIWGLPKLNHDNIEVNLYFVRNVIDWISETGADAIRIDAAKHVEKHFWAIFKLFAKGLHPNVTIIGEDWDSSPSVVAPYQDVYGFDSMFDYPLYTATVDVFAYDHPFSVIARPELNPDEAEGIVNQDQAYRNAYQLVTFLGNHDNPRFLHLAGGEAPESAIARTRLALTFLFTTRGIPSLYYGDELAMLGGPDPDNRRDMRWDLVDEPVPGSPDSQRALEMHPCVQQLIALRKSSKALRYGLLTTLYVTKTVYAFVRTFFDEVRLVVLNNSADSAEVVIPIESNPRLPLLAKGQLFDGLVLTNLLLPGPDENVEICNGSLRVQVSDRAAKIYAPAGTVEE